MDGFQLHSLAHQFTRNALRLTKGDNVWIEYQGKDAAPLMKACVAQVRAAGAHPHVKDIGSPEILRMAEGLTRVTLESYAEQSLKDMQRMQAYLRIKDDNDIARLPRGVYGRFNAANKPVTDYRVNNLRWLLVANPSEAFAKVCGMNLPQFEQFYCDVNLLDYSRMETAVPPLKDLLQTGKNVHIRGVNTDLKFSIKGINAVACYGRRNLPDGESYTAPVKDSVKGHITFGPSCYDGERFKSLYVAFEAGKAVKVVAENDERTAVANHILDRDAGARYVGEFAVAFNPYALHPTGSILFDEKISGSLHLALGDCYDAASNGNKSSVHWDMVHIQRPDYGGGEIWTDKRLIRKDGIFVVPELQGLNPDALKTPAPSVF